MTPLQEDLIAKFVIDPVGKKLIDQAAELDDDSVYVMYLMSAEVQLVPALYYIGKKYLHKLPEDMRKDVQDATALVDSLLEKMGVVEAVQTQTMTSPSTVVSESTTVH